MHKLNLDDRKHFIHTVNLYGNAFVVEDKYNFYSDYSSVAHIKKPDNCVLGLNISKDF